MKSIDTSEARSAILCRVRAGKPAPVAHPDVPMYSIPGDIKSNFLAQLKAFDGSAQEFATRQEALQWLEANVDTATRRVCSAVADFKGNCTPADYPDPHKATDIDVMVTESSLGVGEMGSVFLTDADLGKPACALLSTDLYVLLDEAALVEGMHQAYAALNLRARPYGSFFSGPSATADIEAVHVTGAQAEISLTVLLYKSR